MLAGVLEIFLQHDVQLDVVTPQKVLLINGLSGSLAADQRRIDTNNWINFLAINKKNWKGTGQRLRQEEYRNRAHPMDCNPKFRVFQRVVILFDDHPLGDINIADSARLQILHLISKYLELRVLR